MCMPVYLSEASCGAERLPWQLKVSLSGGGVCACVCVCVLTPGGAAEYRGRSTAGILQKKSPKLLLKMFIRD